MFNPVAVSNRFVAENISTRAALQRAARELAKGAAERGIAIAFNAGPGAANRLEAVADVDDPQWLAEIPGFRAEDGGLKHIAGGVHVRIHQTGKPIEGGPVCWPSAAESDNLAGIPVLRMNAYLESELARALNSPDAATHEDNVVAAILAAGAALDRTLELHPYVAERYQDLWERAQGQQLWPAVA